MGSPGEPNVPLQSIEGKDYRWEHILIVVDMFITDFFNRFGEPRPNDPPPGIVTPYYAALGDTIKRLKLDVQQLAPSHGRGVVPVAELNQTLVGTVQAPSVR